MTKGISFFTRSRLLADILTGLLIITCQVMAFAQLPEDVPRSETLIVDQIFRYGTPNNFNMWVPSSTTPTRQGFLPIPSGTSTSKPVNGLMRSPNRRRCIMRISRK